MCHYEGHDAWPHPTKKIPLRCFCGNAVLRPAYLWELGAREIVTNLCPECDSGGGYEEQWYLAPDGSHLSYGQWMEFKGLEP